MYKKRKRRGHKGYFMTSGYGKGTEQVIKGMLWPSEV
jgi:hypothetical protein